ncbi:MAG: type II secretion system protein GspG [Phycisphaerae bacterium]|nr:type II secretion system protein GspG [Phycisphaerae bacterium]
MKAEIKVLIAISCILAAVYGLAHCFMVCFGVRPRSATRSALTFWAWRINEYTSQTGSLPASLSDIPQKAGYSYDLKDGWGRTINYEIDANGRITLSSYGKDGRKGGVQEDADEVISGCVHITV